MKFRPVSFILALLTFLFGLFLPISAFAYTITNDPSTGKIQPTITLSQNDVNVLNAIGCYGNTIGWYYPWVTSDALGNSFITYWDTNPYPRTNQLIYINTSPQTIPGKLITTLQAEGGNYWKGSTFYCYLASTGAGAYDILPSTPVWSLTENVNYSTDIILTPTLTPTPTPSSDFTVSNATMNHTTGEFSFDYTGYTGGNIVAVSPRNDESATIYNWPAGEIGYGPLSCTSTHCSGTGSQSQGHGTIACSNSLLFDIYDGVAEYYSQSFTVSDLDPSCSTTPTPTPTLTLTPTPSVTFIQTATYNGHTYYLFPSDNWTNSEAYAQSLGGHLVTINDDDENTFVYNTFTNNGAINRGLWIGLNDAVNEGTFVWADGEPVTFTKFGTGEPNNFQGIEDYVHIFYPSESRHPFWNDAPDLASPFYGIPFYGVVEVPNSTPTPTPSNQAPVVTWTTDTATLDEGDTFTAAGSFTDPDSTSWTATVNYGDGTGTQPLTLNPDKTFALSHVYVDNGTYTITVSVTDNQGLTGTSTGSGGSVTVNNPAPVIDPITPPEPSDQNTETTITIIYSDYGNQNHTATINWGDGSGTQSNPVSGGVYSPTHNYQNPGTYTVIITITDSLGASTTQTVTITVLNVDPEVGTISVPSPVWVNESVPLSVSFTDLGTVDTHTASINWGDGMTSLADVTETNGSGSVSGEHVYLVDGIYEISVTVTDDDGGVGTATKEIVVNNRPPYVDPFPGALINAGETFSASSLFTDPDSISWTATVDYGEGAVTEGLTLNPDKTFSLTHQYNTPGEYTVTVVVTDDSGGTGTTMATVTVNALPVIDTLPDETLQEGDTYSATGSFTDSDSTSWTATVDYGEGAGEQTISLNPDNTFIVNNLYEDNGIYNVVVTITDENGAVDTETIVVTVTNATPQVGTITASVNPIQVFSSTSTTASFTDAGVLDTHIAIWDWGDGMTSLGYITENNGSGTVTGEHVYVTAGVYEVTLTITDNDSGNGTAVYQYLSVYNPTPQGLFNGVRKFTTPQGSYTANPNLSGQVLFGITSKYQGTDPTGDVSMSFNAANFEFEATGITVFVISNGNEATLRGTGTVNGIPGYIFLVTGVDGGSGGDDFVRFQIKDVSNNIVFDSQPGVGDTADPTALITAGNIAIH